MVTILLSGCLPFSRTKMTYLKVILNNLLESHFPNSLQATIHMLIQLHPQVAHPTHGSHGYMNQWPVGDCFFSIPLAPFLKGLTLGPPV